MELRSKPLIYDLNLIDLQSLVSSWGEPDYRANQIWQGLYRNYMRDPDSFTNLPGRLRTRLADSVVFSHLQSISIQESSDRQTQKTLFRLPDMQSIETVLMTYSNRNTLCISTQAGCAMGCVFCATGQMGFRRNLSSGEIVEQVLHYARELSTQAKAVSNVVIMGMGEPFHNYDATMAAVDRLSHPQGFKFGARRFTVSTVGLVPMINRFAEERRQVNLAVSLHAADDELRSSMLPVNRKYPLAQLMDACRNYVQLTHRRITFEWALIRDINDTSVQAIQLASLVGDLLCHVNIIPLNPTRKFTGQATTRERAQQFQKILETHGIPCSIRLRRGIDIHAGCGQLATDLF